MTIDYSVVIICFNQEGYIADAVASVLAQTAMDKIKEIVLVDDGSSDGSFAIMPELAAQHPKVIALTQENSGGCAAPRNAGIPHCTGDYVGFLDGDDLWLPNKVQSELQMIENAPEAGLLFCDFNEFETVADVRRPVRVNHYEVDQPKALEKFFVYGGPIPPSCAVVRRDVFDKIGVFDPTMKFNEDSEFWLRLAAEFPIQHIPQVLMEKRVWMGSLGSGTFKLENIACLEEISRRMIEKVPSLKLVANKRQARIDLAAGTHWLEVGNKTKATRHLVQTIVNDPLRLKAWAYLIVCYMPGRASRYLGRLRAAKNSARGLGRSQ